MPPKPKNPIKRDRVSLSEIAKKHGVGRHLDIFHTRRSQALNDTFLERLRRVWGADFNRSLPMIYAISNAATDSVVIALGRLLNPTAKGRECTLAIYRARVINYLDKYGPVLSESSHAKAMHRNWSVQEKILTLYSPL